MMKLLSVYSVFVCSLILGSGLAYAHPQKTHYVIPINPFPPWVIEAESNTKKFIRDGIKKGKTQSKGVISGIDIDIINILSSKLDFTYELVSCPFARCLKLLENGQADLMLGLFKRSYRESFISYIEPGYYKNDPKVFYVNKDANISITQYEDLRKLRVGVVQGTGYFSPFDTDASILKESVTHDLQLLRMLKTNRIDTFVGTPNHISYLMDQKLNNDPFLREGLILKKGEFSHVGFSKKSKHLHLKHEFSVALKDTLDEALMNSLVAKYLNKTPSVKPGY